MTATQDYSVLLNRSWTLVTVVHADEAPVDVTSRGLVFTFSEQDDVVVVSQNGCMTNGADVSRRGTLVFARSFVSMLMISCPRLPRIEQAFLYGQLLTDAVHYTVTDSRLVLRKPGTGQLHLTS